jgi:hypothetical protein
VGDIGDEVAAMPIDVRQLGSHVVERPGQDPDLIGAGGGHLHRVVAARHPPGGDRHFAQGSGHPGSEHLGDDERDGDRHRNDQPRLNSVASPDRGDDGGHQHAQPDEGAELDLQGRESAQRGGHRLPSSRA